MSFRPSLTAPTKHWEALGDNATRMFLVNVLNSHEYTFLSMSLSAFPTKLPKHHFRASLVHTSKLLQFQDLWTTCCRTSKELFYFCYQFSHYTNFPLLSQCLGKAICNFREENCIFSPILFPPLCHPPPHQLWCSTLSQGHSNWAK